MIKQQTVRTSEHLLQEVLQLDAHLIEEFVQKITDLADVPLEVERRIINEQFVALACSMYEMRRLRGRFLSASMLGEPVWDMLLALYCFTARHEALSVTGLCHAADVPLTTALRWVRLLEQKKLITRRPDRHDGRRKFLALTAMGEILMTDYLKAAQGRLEAGERAAGKTPGSTALDDAAGQRAL
jgi:DNA-binding MarR family transcriptional regulator